MKTLEKEFSHGDQKYFNLFNDLVNLSEWSLNFFCQNIIVTEHGMLYMVGKNFLCRISFYIVYNEAGHIKYEQFEYRFFSQRSGKKYQSFYNRD